MSDVRAYATEAPTDYTDRVRRCVTQMQNARQQPMFQQKVLVAPDLLNEWYDCMWQYLNEYAVASPAPSP